MEVFRNSGYVSGVVMRMEDRHANRSILAGAGNLFFSPGATIQGQAPPPGTPAFRVTSRLVYLDVTVLDRKGRPVVTGLTRDDFTITESKKLQPIFSFDAPETHVQLNPANENPSGQASLTVLQRGPARRAQPSAAGTAL
jgi:hypothetical protein